VWEEKAQIQGVPIVDKEEKGGTCSKATKDVTRGEASAPCKGKA